MTNNIIIYKIFCKNEEIKECYVGSTSNLKKRIQQHKTSCNNENDTNYNNYKYIFIREHGGWDNWDFKILCECPKEDRFKMERWHIENDKYTNLNKSIPTRTNKEYRQKNKDKISKKEKEYYQKNKDKIKEKHKDYYEKNKDIIIEKNKEWYENNKDKISIQKKEFRQKNKDKILKIEKKCSM